MQQKPRINRIKIRKIINEKLLPHSPPIPKDIFKFPLSCHPVYNMEFALGMLP